MIQGINWPSFIAAPFMVSSTATISSAAPSASPIQVQTSSERPMVLAYAGLTSGLTAE
jgi:hypothetical protein